MILKLFTWQRNNGESLKLAIATGVIILSRHRKESCKISEGK